MQNQFICIGCRRVLQYRRGATSVCCAVCNTLNAVNSSGAEMSELICSGCRTLLIYTRGATNIRCSRCNRVNSARSAAQFAHVMCGQCRTTLMYPHGASTVECAICHYVNNVRMNNTRASASGHSTSGSNRPSSAQDAYPQTVLVENPKTLDERGKLVNNVVVGVTTWRR